MSCSCHVLLVGVFVKGLTCQYWLSSGESDELVRCNAYRTLSLSLSVALCLSLFLPLFSVSSECRPPRNRQDLQHIGHEQWSRDHFGCRTGPRSWDPCWALPLQARLAQRCDGGPGGRQRVPVPLLCTPESVVVLNTFRPGKCFLSCLAVPPREGSLKGGEGRGIRNRLSAVLANRNW